MSNAIIFNGRDKLPVLVVGGRYAILTTLAGISQIAFSNLKPFI